MLTDQAIRAAALVPVAVIGVSALVEDASTRPALLLGILSVLVLLVIGGLTAPRLALLDSERPPLVPALVGAAGVVAGVVALIFGLGGEPGRYTTIFAVVIVAAAFALPRRQRGLLVAWALLGWTVTVLVTGPPDPVAKVTQLGGAVLVALVALRTTRALEFALTVEREASRASRTRASLLTTVLRLQVLEPGAVDQAVVEGVREAGFASAALYRVDGPELRLLASRPSPGEQVPERLDDDGGLAAAARREERVQLRREDLVGGAPPLRGAIAAPVRIDGSVAAVLVARRHAAGLTASQVEAVELLAEEAGTALTRARRFAADAATVAELRRLDARTHDFVSTVSHELRTPMTVVQGLGQTLDRRWDDLTPERREDLLRRVDQNAERLAVMVRSLVDTSALERGQLLIDPRPVPLGAAVAGVLGRLASLLEEHRVHVDVPDGLVVAADPSLLEHVLENLLGNAARHTPAGTDVRVRAVATHDGDVEVEVADDGPGIADADLPHVLERFYRAGDPTTRPAGGLGLGLALSQQVLRAHGRELTVRSAPGEGTRFAFRLPRVEGDDAPTRLPPPPGARPGT